MKGPNHFNCRCSIPEDYRRYLWYAWIQKNCKLKVVKIGTLIPLLLELNNN